MSLSRRSLLIFALAIPVAGTILRPAYAASPEVFSTKGVAISGYDAVAYFTEGKPVKGDPLRFIADTGAGFEGNDRQCGTHPHKDGFGFGVFKPKQLRHKIFFRRLYGDLCNRFHPIGGKPLFASSQSSFTEHIILIEEADLLYPNFSTAYFVTTLASSSKSG